MFKTLYKTIAVGTLIAFTLPTQAVQNDNTPQSSAIKIFDTQKLAVDARADQSESIKDPWQGFNRKIYVFNDAIDRNVLRPVAVIYADTVPEPAQGAYTNFRNNLKEPWNAVNQILQGKPKTSFKTLGRFTINTLTSLGFVDTAKRLDIVNESEDFGTTLGVWGVPSGPYLVLPLFGPSTLRDALGSIPDGFAKPQGYIDPDELMWTNTALEVTATRAQYLSIDSVIKGDKYAAMRDVYLQQSAFNIAEKRGEDISQSMFAEDPLDEDLPEEDSEEEFINETNEN